MNGPGNRGGSNHLGNGAMNKSAKFPSEVRERAVRMVQEHWALESEINLAGI
jgi:hypothetical protein